MSDKWDVPAYPQGIDQGASDAGFPIVEHRGGITIRQAFVMAAMQGLCANSSLGDFSYAAYATQAIWVADATLKALDEHAQP